MGLFNSDENSFMGFTKFSPAAAGGSRGYSGNSQGSDQQNDFLSNYNAILEKYKNTPYYEMLKNNPWLQTTFNPTFGDQLLNTFGLRSPYDQSETERQQNAWNYVADVLSMKFTNDYNSDSAKVARMENAGLNADLLGTSGSSESGVMPSNDKKVVPQSPMDDIGHYVTTIGSCISFAFSIFDKVINVKKSILDLDSDELTTEKKAKGIADEIGSDTYSEGYPDPNQIKAAIKTEVPGVSKRNSKRLQRYLTQYYNSARASDKFWSTKDSAQKHMISSASDNALYMPEGTLDEVTKSLADLTYKFMTADLNRKTSQNSYEKNRYDTFNNSDFFAGDLNFQMSNFRSGVAKNNYDTSYYRTASGEQKGKYENSSYLESEQMKHTRTLINDSMRDLISSLSERSKKGDMFAKSLLISLSVGMAGGLSIPLKK